MDVGEWLRRLGLEQYEPAFRANEIDERVLPSLTGEDLKDLYIVTDLINAAPGRIYIAGTDGTMTANYYNAFADAQNFTSLEGITYPKDSD